MFYLRVFLYEKVLTGYILDSIVKRKVDLQMKIAIVVRSLTMGGLEKVTVHIANELAKQYDVDLIVLHENQNLYEINKELNLIESQITYSFLQKVKRGLHLKINSKIIIKYPKEIQYLKSLFLEKKYSTVIAVDGYSSMMVHQIKKELKASHLNVISWVHNNYETYFNNYYKHFKNELFEAFHDSQTVVTLTKSDQLAYSQCNEHSVTIYNPITIRENKGSNLMNHEILFVARLNKEHKGLDYLIELGKQLKGSGWIIRVLGDGDDRKWFESQIARFDLNDVFVLEGSVKENIERYYEQASLFISTSKWEGLPLVMIEAISSGLPVISFNHSGAIEILGENEHGIIVNMGEIDQFYEQLTFLMNSYERRKIWSEKSLKRSEDFKIDSILKEWGSILK